jgi:hypothetical protein
VKSVKIQKAKTQPEGSPRVLGGWKGRVRITKDFDETPATLIAAFEGKKSSASRSQRRK